MNNNRVYRIFVNKVYWLLCLGIPLLLVVFDLVMKYIYHENDISLKEIILGYLSSVFGICILTLLICLIIDTVIDFKNDSIKGRIFMIILLVIYTLKDVMDYLSSH